MYAKGNPGRFSSFQTNVEIGDTVLSRRTEEPVRRVIAPRSRRYVARERRGEAFN